MIRVERLLANRGYCARSGAQGFLRAQDVRAGGKRVGRADERVDENTVTVGGEAIDPAALVVMLHKPVGVTCSHDKSEGPLVYDLLPERWRRRDPVMATVGRLDKETSGLLLVTDDGVLLHRLTSPKHHVDRVYVARLDRDLRGNEAQLFGSGTLVLESDDKPLLPAGLEVLGAREARITLREGRYHQIRRMFAAVGNHVLALHRESFGPLRLTGMAGEGELAERAFRVLSVEEERSIRAS